MIANILNGQGYSKLNQIVKENINVILAENKELISISFAVLIQTLKADSHMVKLIQNILCVNDGQQHKDNDINITQYFESNKDNILYLTEKNYENLVEALTNNVINTAAVAASSSSNLSLSQPQSSSTFLNLSSQSDTHRKEDPEIFHNSKGDIAD